MNSPSITYSTDVFGRPRVEVNTDTHKTQVYAFGDMHHVHVSAKQGGRLETVLILSCNSIIHGLKLARPALDRPARPCCGWCKNSLATYSPTVINRDYNGRQYCPTCWDELHS